MSTATATLLTLRPEEGHPENAGAPTGGPFGLVQIGVAVKGNAFPAKVDSAIDWVGRIPTLYTATTGLTFNLLLADDGGQAGGATVARFAVTVKLLTSGTDVLDWTTAGTQTVVSVTMPATAGAVKTLAIPIVAANIDSVVADSWCAIRVQRLGKSDALDVNPGRLVLLVVDVRDT